MSEERDEIIVLIDQARAAGARQSEACSMVGISAKTYQRWTRTEQMKGRRLEPTHKPGNKLSEWERQQLLKVANEPEYADLPPGKISSSSCR